MQKPKLLYKCWIAQSIVSTSFEAITVLPKTNVALKNCSWICKAADILSSGRVLNVPCVLLPLLICLVVFSYTGAGVVRQRAVVGQGDVFLLPLLIQRAPTSLPQDALSKRKKKKKRTEVTETCKKTKRIWLNIESTQQRRALQSPTAGAVSAVLIDRLVESDETKDSFVLLM